MSKLRRLLGPLLAARPYRLLGDVHSDFRQVEKLLLAGDVAGALRTHRAPLLVESDAPRIVQARDELEGALRRAARAGGQDTLWAWLALESGRDDLAGLREFIREAPPDDPRVRGRGLTHERAAAALGLSDAVTAPRAAARSRSART